MIEGVLQVSEMRVRDIMIPRIQMVVVPREADLATIFPLVIESAHSRFPVIDEDRSEVVGVLLAKDLLVHSRQDETLRVEEIMRAAHFIPESIIHLSQEFKKGTHTTISDEGASTRVCHALELVMRAIPECVSLTPQRCKINWPLLMR